MSSTFLPPAGAFSETSDLFAVTPVLATREPVVCSPELAAPSVIVAPELGADVQFDNGRDNALLSPDSISAGLFFVLIATLVQRTVGMVRGVLFCDLMSEEQVGLFSLGFSSLVLLAPFAVLGIPGSFGRYVEYYRQRGALGTYLRRTICVSLGLGAALSLLIVLFAPWTAVLMFNQSSQTRLAIVTGGSLFFVVMFNLLNELTTALRKNRRSSWMQFISSIAFAISALVLLWTSGGFAEYAIVGYGLACIAASLVAWPVIRAVWSITDAPGAQLSHQEMWTKLIPYTAWLWAFNLLANVFDISDRYLILWWSQASTTEAQALVGQLHSARVFPVIIVGLATMMGGILLPHLSHDWEQGERERVARKLRFALKMVSIVFSILCAGVIFAAPLVFHIIWRGRFDQGLGLLPITCAMCVWQCLTIMVHQYLWCTERARLACVPIVVGLLISLTLNAFLLPLFGIQGAAVSAAVANLAALTTSLIVAHVLGLRNELGIGTFILWPGILVLGLWSGILALMASIVGGAALLMLLKPHEKQLLREQAEHLLRHFRRAVSNKTSEDRSRRSL